MPNPLIAGPKAAAPAKPPSPTLDTAAAAISKMNLSPAQAAQKADATAYMVHLLAPLARGDKKVTTKDLAKVAADAVSEGHMTAADAVKFLTNAPSEPPQIKQMVQQLYKGSLLAAINLAPAKQAIMGAPGAVTQPPPPAEVQAAQQATPAPSGVV